MDDAPPKTPPRGTHISYWRHPLKSARNAAGHSPLEPLGVWQIVGIIAVVLLIACLVLMSVGWWVHAVHR